MDYLDDRTLGIDSATAIAELAASSAAAGGMATWGAGALPTGVVVAMTVVVAYVAAYAAKKGVAYIIGDYITGAKTGKTSPWSVTNQEYNNIGLLA